MHDQDLLPGGSDCPQPDWVYLLHPSPGICVINGASALRQKQEPHMFAGRKASSYRINSSAGTCVLLGRRRRGEGSEMSTDGLHFQPLLANAFISHRDAGLSLTPLPGLIQGEFRTHSPVLGTAPLSGPRVQRRAQDGTRQVPRLPRIVGRVRGHQWG